MTGRPYSRCVATQRWSASSRTQKRWGRLAGVLGPRNRAVAAQFALLLAQLLVASPLLAQTPAPLEPAPPAAPAPQPAVIAPDTGTAAPVPEALEPSEDSPAITTTL